MGLSLTNGSTTENNDRHSKRVAKNYLEDSVNFVRALMIAIPLSLLLWGCVLWGILGVL